MSPARRLTDDPVFETYLNRGRYMGVVVDRQTDISHGTQRDTYMPGPTEYDFGHPSTEA
jgi:hypothetical protein